MGRLDHMPDVAAGQINSIDSRYPQVRRMSPDRRRVAGTLGKWVDFTVILLKFVAGILLLVLAFTPRDTVAARIVEGIGGSGLLVWALIHLRWWRSADWYAM
jgi:hypothetical protein